MSAPDLSKLHDFYQPPLPSWMPQTIGWYVLLGLLVALVLFLAFRHLRSWIRNRYRREALREIEAAAVVQLSEILKRVAMVTWSRNRVASLTGSDWTKFLADSSGLSDFHSAPGERIETIALANGPVTPQEQKQLRQLASEWVRRHHD
jgi:Domain of unknown function (DUF4381)